MRALHHVRTAPVRAAVRLQAMQADRDAGMTTAEYAVGTVAACGFSGILYKVITSPEVLGLITSVIGKAFKLSF
jgi:pilus assembly protein TadC